MLSIVREEEKYWLWSINSTCLLHLKSKPFAYLLEGFLIPKSSHYNLKAKKGHGGGAGGNRKACPDLRLGDAPGISLNPPLWLWALSLQTVPEVWSWLRLASATQTARKELAWPGSVNARC